MGDGLIGYHWRFLFFPRIVPTVAPPACTLACFGTTTASPGLPPRATLARSVAIVWSSPPGVAASALCFFLRQTWVCLPVWASGDMCSMKCPCGLSGLRGYALAFGQLPVTWARDLGWARCGDYSQWHVGSNYHAAMLIHTLWRSLEKCLNSPVWRFSLLFSSYYLLYSFLLTCCIRFVMNQI